ncbi:ABC transporter permease [Gallaecimonas sp. GXIMD4217]|uniref:ABC transporter permease n=1 Tax=Gallaecimonas sp. GXIMD4217 TaxID=3131927 RepID=UPI00311AD4E5
MWTIFRKELQELIRDKKTLFFAIAMPFIMVPLFFGIGLFAAKQVENAKNEELKVAVNRALPQVVEAIEAAENLTLVTGLDLSDIKAVIRDEQADAVLVIPEDFEQARAGLRQSQWQVHFNDSSAVNMVLSRIEKSLKPMTDGLKDEYAATLEIDEGARVALMEPVSLEKVSVADERESLGDTLGRFLPYLLFFSCLMGAMYPAIDLGAGEKERGTLETLLLSPMPRTQLVLGKFMIVFMSALVAALISVTSLAVWGLVLGQQLAIEALIKIIGTIGLVDILFVMAMLVPIAAIFGALMLSLSIYARSYKEAQNYMGLLQLPLILPVMLTMFPGVELTAQWALVPLTNVALAIKDIIKGTIDYSALWLILGSTLVLAGALISFCVYWFRQEKVLFR